MVQYFDNVDIFRLIKLEESQMININGKISIYIRKENKLENLKNRLWKITMAKI